MWLCMCTCVCTSTSTCVEARGRHWVPFSITLYSILLRGVATAPMWLSVDIFTSPPPLPPLHGSWRLNPLLCLHSQAPLAISPAPPRFFKSGSLTELVTSTRLSGYRGFGICLPLTLPPVLGVQMYKVMLSFYVGVGDQNLGPHACAASTLPTEPTSRASPIDFQLPLVT